MSIHMDCFRSHSDSNLVPTARIFLHLKDLGLPVSTDGGIRFLAPQELLRYVLSFGRKDPMTRGSER